MSTNETPAARYDRLAARFTETIDAVPEDRWDDQSPCEEWSARQVVEHVVDTERDLLGRFDQTSGLVADLPADPIEAWPKLRAAMSQVMDDPELAGHGYDGMMGPTTIGQTVDTFYAMDLLVHRWDLAKATGLRDHEAMDPADVDHYHAAIEHAGDMLRSPGVCGPAVEVAPDASAQDRFVAFLGRHP